MTSSDESQLYVEESKWEHLKSGIPLPNCEQSKNPYFKLLGLELESVEDNDRITEHPQPKTF